MPQQQRDSARTPERVPQQGINSTEAAADDFWLRAARTDTPFGRGYFAFLGVGLARARTRLMSAVSVRQMVVGMMMRFQPLAFCSSR